MEGGGAWVGGGGGWVAIYQTDLGWGMTLYGRAKNGTIFFINEGCCAVVETISSKAGERGGGGIILTNFRRLIIEFKLIICYLALIVLCP